MRLRLFLFAFAFASALASTATTAAAGASTADLSVTVSGPGTLEQYANGQTPISYGGGNYTVTITNAGPATATDVVLTVRFGGGVYWDAFDTTFGDCSLAGSAVTCRIGTLAPGASLTRTFAFYPGTSGTWKTMFSVSAGQPDNKQNDNAVVKKVVVIPPTHADLQVSQSTASGSGSVGQPVLLVTFVTNGGPADATNVTETIVLPDGLSFVPDGSSAGCTANGQTVTCLLGDQPYGSTNQPVDIYVVAARPGQYTITETLSSDQPDQNTSNNTETIYLSVS